MVNRRSVRRIGGAVVIALLAFGRTVGARDVRTSVVLGTPPALQLDVEYQDPVTMFSRLKGTLVFPVWVTARNISSQPVTLGVHDLELTLGSLSGPTVALRPVEAADARKRLREDAEMSDVLKWLTNNRSWAPDPFERPLTSLVLGPSQSRSGYVFFLRPAGFQFNGFMTVATTVHRAELLPTEIIRSDTRTRSNTAGVLERFVKAASTLPGLKPLPDILYGRPFEKSYALLFGISTYDDAGKNLPGAARDVERMKAYLIAQGFDRVVVLSDRAVTESALRQVQAHFHDQIRPDDRLLVYYAGHGRRSNTGAADLVLSSGARVPMERFMSWIRGVRVKHLLVLLDACYSGTVITGVRDVLEPLDLRTRDKIYALASEGSRFVITAGDANEVAHEDVRKWGGGLFTSAVLRALKPPSKGVGIVTTYDLYSRVKDFVVDEVHKNGLTAQMPRIKDLGFGGDGKTPPDLSRGEFVFVGSS